MKIPPDAIIPKRKLTHYLLVWRDEDDKSRFLALAGFTSDNPDDLEAAIRTIIAENEAFEDGGNEFGIFYRVEGGLIGTNGRILSIVTIWMLKTSIDNRFWFVTLKPGRKVER